MEDTRRGRIVILASLLSAIVFFLLVATYSMYYATLNKKGDLLSDSLAINDDSTIRSNYPTVDNQNQDIVITIRKIKEALAQKYQGPEPPRFNQVFSELEIALIENRIFKGEIERLPEILKRYLQDGKLTEGELENILDFLELSIIPKQEQ